MEDENFEGLVSDSNIEAEMDYAQKCLSDALSVGLEIEFIVWALKAMKNNNQLTIKEALEAGCEEWDI